MNKITQLFNIKYPIIQGGMIWNSGYKLASAVSNAGGLGLIGAGSMYPEVLREHIQKCKKATDKPSRVIFISSDSHQTSSFIDHDEFGRFFEYGLKKGMNNYSYYKLVLNTLAVEISKRMNKDKATPDVAFNVICPGPVNTDIVRDAPWLIRMMLKGIFSIFFQTFIKLGK